MSAAEQSLLRRRSVLGTAALLVAVLCCEGGCVATKYKLARKNTAPAEPLNIAFPPSEPLQSTLAALITYGSPGSWKRTALWDEYVITLQNQGGHPLAIDFAMLAGSAGTIYAAGNDPWVVEKQSKLLEKQYRDRGEAFIRAAGPGVLIVGAGAAAAAATTASVYVSAAAAGAVAATVVVLPVYYLSVVGINHHNKKAVMNEFARRRLPLPLTLAPGETRTGSLFYPMVRNPSSLELQWSTDTTGGKSALPLNFLKGLHVPIVTAETSSRAPGTRIDEKR
jgi:hypothetical protein